MNFWSLFFRLDWITVTAILIAIAGIIGLFNVGTLSRVFPKIGAKMTLVMWTMIGGAAALFFGYSFIRNIIDEISKQGPYAVAVSVGVLVVVVAAIFIFYEPKKRRKR